MKTQESMSGSRAAHLWVLFSILAHLAHLAHLAQSDFKCNKQTYRYFDICSRKQIQEIISVSIFGDVLSILAHLAQFFSDFKGGE